MAWKHKMIRTIWHLDPIHKKNISTLINQAVLGSADFVHFGFNNSTSIMFRK